MKNSYIDYTVIFPGPWAVYTYFFLHEGGGPVFKFINFILCLVNKRWRKRLWKPWHISVPVKKTMTGWWVMEGASPKSRIHWYSNEYIARRVRAYHWLDVVPNDETIQSFFASYIGKQYDVQVYWWTALQYLVRHFLNRRIPRLLDDRYTCWELACEWAEANGKPMTSKYDCPMITDILDNLEGVTNDKVPQNLIRVDSPWGIGMRSVSPP